MRKTVFITLFMVVFGCAGNQNSQTDISTNTDTATDSVTDSATDSVTDTDSGTATDTVTDSATDIPSPTGIYARFNPEAQEWGGLPFPGNYMINASGNIDFALFPNPDQKPLIEAYLAEISENIHGFSPAQTVYVSFSSQIDVSGLKRDYLPANDSRIVMVDISYGDHYGEMVPILWKYQGNRTKFWPANTLAVKPVWGFVLHEGDTYAMYVTNSLHDQSGNPLSNNPWFQACLKGNTTCPALFADALKPLHNYLNDKAISIDDVVGGTVFTIAQPRAELLAIRDYIDSKPAPKIVDIKKTDDTSLYQVYEGHYKAPNFLHGKAPYKNTGGGFEFNSNGVPKVDRMETMRFALTIPNNAGSGPIPIAVVMHGTGGDYHTFLRSGFYNEAVELAKVGIACIGIDEPIHGARVDPPLSADETDLYSFNIFNPTAGRTIQRQSIADEISLLRMIQSGNLNTNDFSFDPSKVLFWGHSQGGISGAMLFGVEDRFVGGVLSGAGAGLTNAVLDRTINVGGADLDAKQAISIIFNIPIAQIDQFHPILTMAQQAVDVTDPNSYTPFYFKTWSSNGHPRQVFMTQGLKDVDSPPSVAEAMIAGAGLPVVAPTCEISMGMALKGITGTNPPISANIRSKYTAGAMQFCKYGHFAAFESPVAACTYKRFMEGLANGQAPLIDPCQNP